MDFQTTTDVIIGMVMPGLIALINQAHWDAKVKGLVALVSCLIVSTLVALFRGGLDWADWRNTVVVLTGSALVTYHVWWKPSTVAPTLEVATSTSQPLEQGAHSADEAG
jgi:hypothetical protein